MLIVHTNFHKLNFVAAIYNENFQIYGICSSRECVEMYYCVVDCRVNVGTG